MICKMHGYWNDKSLPDGKYHAPEVTVRDSDAVGLMRSWYDANISTDGLGIKIETTENTMFTDKDWTLLYEGPLNEVVIMGLACKLKGVAFV